MENLLFEDTYLKSLTFDELTDFITFQTDDGILELSNGLLVMRSIGIPVGKRIYSAVLALIDPITGTEDHFVKDSNKIFKVNKSKKNYYEYFLEYLCDLDSPFLNTVFNKI